MLRDLTRLSGSFASRFALDHDVEVDKFFGECRHIVLEAEGIFANCVGSENKVTLALALAVEYDLVSGIFDLVVDVK